MSDIATLPPPLSSRPYQGFFGRLIGIIVSPRRAYADVVRRPRALAALALFLLVAVASSWAFLSTAVGKEALLDQQIGAIEAFGRQVPDQAYQRMEAMLPYAPYMSAVYSLVLFPLATLAVAGLSIAIFNAALGGTATFGQVYGVVTHSLVVIAVQRLFTYPLDYAKQSLASPTNLGVFLPFLDEASFPGRLLGSIDLFLIWWIVNLAIGLGVLYKKRTAPIAGGMLAVYAAVAALLAAVRTIMSSGA